MNRKQLNKSLLITLLLTVIPFIAIAEEDIDPRIIESRKVIKEFAEKLQKELVQAMEEGGPENAIKVCNIEAPGISTTLSEKYQWKVGRTSLKTRNRNNDPDDWELAVLINFEERKNNGEDIKQLEYSEDTKDGFRYMKAIPTKGLCLTCHGENIDKSLKRAISKLYPNDLATGFKAGDIRGAFTIIQKQN